MRRSARVPRVYHNGTLNTDTELTLDKPASHHLLAVLRARINDTLVLFNGDGNNYTAVITQGGQRGASAKQAVLRITSCHAGVSDSSLALTLVQCVSRPERMDISLRQAVELGVTTIQPVHSRQSVKPGDDQRTMKKSQHWHSIVISACEQSGRSTLPALATATSFEQWLKRQNEHQPSAGQKTTCLVLSPTAEQSLTDHIMQLSGKKLPTGISLIIGPESGLDTDEIDAAVSAGVIPVTLGKRILRTETAGPACIAIVQSLLGDLRAT